MTHRLPILFTALLALSACTWLGVPAPETFNERVAVAQTQVTAARLTATELVTVGLMSPDDGQNVQDQADAARAGIDLARQIHATTPEAGETRLELSIAVLTALQNYLRAKGGNP